MDRKQREREYKRKKTAEKLLRKEEQMRMNIQNSLKHSKTLPAITKDSNGEIVPQNWYHIRMDQHERIKYLESMYTRFNNIYRQQRAARKNPDRQWVNFPAQLIDDLCIYEGDPSDELMQLAISEKYRQPNSGNTVEKERARLQIPETVLIRCNWRDFRWTSYIDDDGVEISCIKEDANGPRPIEATSYETDEATSSGVAIREPASRPDDVPLNCEEQVDYEIDDVVTVPEK